MSRPRNFSQGAKHTANDKIKHSTEEELKLELQKLRERKRTQEVMAKHSIEKIRADLGKSISILQQTAAKKIEDIITESSIKTAEVIDMQEQLKRRLSQLKIMIEEKEQLNHASNKQKDKKALTESLNNTQIHHLIHFFEGQIDMKYDPARYSHRRIKEPCSLTSKKQ